MKYILFETLATKTRCYPFTYLRPVSRLLCGILTIKEKWDLAFNTNCSEIALTAIQDYEDYCVDSPQMWINAHVLPDAKLVDILQSLDMGQRLMFQNEIIAFFVDAKTGVQKDITYEYKPKIIYQNYDLIAYNPGQITADFIALNLERGENNGDHMSISNINNVYCANAMEMASDQVKLDGSTGPIYIDEGAKIAPFVVIQGPAYIGKYTEIRPFTYLRGGTSIGPFCTVAGEIKQSIIEGFTNKGHAGYMGNSMVGQWCNWGAGTTNSNTKNNFGSIKTYSYETNRMKDTGLLHLGVMMGDHCMCGINTMFNAGTCIGLGSTVHGAGYMPKCIPPFSWSQLGESLGNFEQYDYDKFIQMVKNVMKDKNVDCTNDYIERIKTVYNSIGQ